ncbi:hypothetical protein [Mycolicibacterium arenosum]|uniref:Secreted protein n=1 Tax=Mycolicibacterium arenosum TaxID=2952157 RepID=A0ABT1M6A8_9MYCO|nr:hypothetical protein [Mycolicibacterium sp. CAU 1645]MCP9273342.1 hypothetical protein [Mycolicibacterium sp. CAU 1645]
MMFTRGLAVSARALVGAVLATTLLITGVGAPSAAAEPPLRHVKYTVFTETPYAGAEIYYRDVDPPNFAEYSHNPYLYSPNVEADLGPNQMWTLDVMLANPDQWAMVTATSLDSPQRPNFHCVLAVDGVVVATNQGPKGALCSIRHW